MDRPSRRRFLQGSLALAGLGLQAGCGMLSPQAQQPPATVPVVGSLWGSSTSSAGDRAAFRQGLRDLGYVAGQSVTIEERFAEGRDERLPELAAELVRLKVDIITTSGTSAGLAAKQATGTIPIVSVSADPVGTGLVMSLARPGGNVTGFTISVVGLWGKRLQLLQEIVPGFSRVASLGDAGSAASALGLREVQDAAQKLGVQVRSVELHGPDDLQGALDATARAQVDGLVVQDTPLTFAYRAPILGLTVQHRLASMYVRREWVDDGGLMAYGVSFSDIWRRAATDVDKILKGAHPSDLPVEQPTQFDFVINLKTARALGLTIPQEVLIQATEVIQ